MQTSGLNRHSRCRAPLKVVPPHSPASRHVHSLNQLAPFPDSCTCSLPVFLFKLQSREADDEAARQSQARACAEESLAITLTKLSEQKVLAHKEAARADSAEASADRLREERSAERSARASLEAEVEKLKAAAKAEAGSRADVEKRMEEAREKIIRLEKEVEIAAAAAVLASESESGGTPSVTPDGSSVDDEGVNARRDSSIASGGSLSESGATGEDDRSEASTVDMIDDCGNDDSFTCGEEEEKEEERSSPQGE